MTAFPASFRYELRMQLRKPSLWITMGALAGLTYAASGNLRAILDQPDALAGMVSSARILLLLLPIGFGCLVADRLVRDERLKVREVLDATPGGQGWRLVGKYLGACLAAGIPVLAAYLMLAVAFAVTRGDPAALGYAAIITGAVIVPALLFVGAFAMLCPLFMPAPLFRVLFIGYWPWATQVDPILLPTINRTLLNPFGGYVIEALGGADLAGSVPGADLNLLRPTPTTVTAVLSVAILLVLAGLALTGARALLARTR